jgi:outer membrane protein OmpA-like peptidoglycan-associated protein
MTNISATRVSAPISRRQVVLGAAALLLVRFSGKAAFAEPRTFFIFFDKESSELLPSAKQILAVINPLIKPNTRTTIVGHCDTSESEPDKLSLARATAVHAALVDVMSITKPNGAILFTSGKGTSEPQKQTGPNVPEPVNRYVSITIQ